MKTNGYIGLELDLANGLTPLARMVLDARLFGLVSDTETCAGWDPARMQTLYDRVYAAWEPWAHLPSQLPDELRARHSSLYDRALSMARALGWEARLGDDD